jgi:D-glycero-D-manno-heptose 1,7-bisphosphate phosphatase
MQSVAQAMTETHRQTGALFDKIMWCSHHPDAQNPEFSRCWCRKPRPGLLIEAALDLAPRFHEYYPPYMALMVGDRDEDRVCAANADIDFMHAIEWRAQADGS